MALRLNTDGPADGGQFPAVRAYVRWILRHGRLLWIAALLLAVPAILRTVHLYANLHSDIEELLPLQAPSVRALDELRTRFGALQFLGVVAEVTSPSDLPAAERFIDDLTVRLQKYPPAWVRNVRTGDTDVASFLEKHAPLYVDLDDLKTLRERIEARRDYEVAKEEGQLLDESEAPPSIDTGDLEAKYRARAEGGPRGRLSNATLRTTMLFVEVGDLGLDPETSRALLRRVQADVASLSPVKYAAGMRVGYASDIAVGAEELEALQVDLSVSSVLVIAAVMAVIVFYYRWWRSIPVLIAPLLLAATYSFGLASLPPFDVQALNSNTAFLGSIIIGNGINVGIILLARYREERLKGATVEDALVAGVAGARIGTLVAAAAASVSYASLVVTEFRGFRQFGVIGGIGMLTSWVTAFVLIPPLLGWLDRDAPSARVLSGERHAVMHGLAKLVQARASWIVVGAGVLGLFSAVEATRFDRSRLEYDLGKLRRVDTWKTGEGYWGRKMDALLGHYLTPTVLLFDNKEDASRAETRVREAVEHGVLGPMIARVIGADDIFPPNQAAKLEEVQRIRRDLTPRIRQLIPEDKREALDHMLGTADLRPVNVAELPEPLTRGLREKNGSIGCALLVYPRPSDVLWKANSIHVFVETLRELARAGASSEADAGRVAGSIPMSEDVLSSIAHDAPIASAVSFAGVIAVLVLIDRKVAGWVVASLVLGVLWLVGAIMWLKIKINFSNFIAFPITFGIGIDYAVNVMNRYTQGDRRDIGAAVRATGGAVALCSLTTIIGYSSLLLAKNQALFLFGVVAVLGEVACLLAAVVVLPAWLVFAKNLRATSGARRREPETPH